METDIRANVREAHADCTECSVCGAGWDRKIAREVPPVPPQAEDRED